MDNDKRERRMVDKRLYGWITTALATLSVVAIVSSYGLVREMAENRKTDEYQEEKILALQIRATKLENVTNQTLQLMGRIDEKMGTIISTQKIGNNELRLLRDWQKANENTVKDAGEYIKKNWNK